MGIVTVLLCSLFAFQAVSSTKCANCRNGGTQMLPNNIFGVCRCKCKANFQGPSCQFLVKKRSSDSLEDWNSELKSDMAGETNNKMEFFRYILDKLQRGQSEDDNNYVYA